MSTPTAVVLGLAGAAGLVLAAGRPTKRSTRRRLVRLDLDSVRGAAGADGRAGAGKGPDAAAGNGHRRPDLIRLGALLGGVAVVVVLGGWTGAVAGVLAGIVSDRLLRRLEPASARRLRLREVADLPLGADLLAAALRAGAPVDRAVLSVAEALGGPLGDRLHRVGRTLRLGGEPAEAWAHLGSVPGGDRLTAAAVRTSTSGAALAGALTRLADDLRADRAVTVEAAARRAGVLIVLPLGLCFLPAFILAGLVPVIVAVLGDVL
ncbi:type II secretion system F family protein [Micromonospora sp. NBC_01796]|uniref:type II secretion system F family protein n=1 Tax=Micromonospora sp. NBC_01796 TaxID=2975987 RepID=UPI002DD7DFFF|nr:type II secretion system F family protein [Micromonospora sp. NBC_01796]WSA88070.1 type II secretion system F family protein [Micromonospora sp. NBC_01796]